MKVFFAVCIFAVCTTLTVAKPKQCKDLPKNKFEDNQSVKNAGQWVMLKTTNLTMDLCNKYTFRFKDPNDHLLATWVMEQLVNKKWNTIELDTHYDKNMENFWDLYFGIQVYYYDLFSSDKDHYTCMYACDTKKDKIMYLSCTTTMYNYLYKDEVLKEIDRKLNELKNDLDPLLGDLKIVDSAKHCGYESHKSTNA